eukprot:gene10262-2412_t
MGCIEGGTSTQASVLVNVDVGVGVAQALKCWSAEESAKVVDVDAISPASKNCQPSVPEDTPRWPIARILYVLEDQSDIYQPYKETAQVLERIAQRDSTEGVVILDEKGTMLHSTMEGGLKSAEDIVKIADQARHVIREVDPTNDLSVLRIRTRKREILITPDEKHLLLVFQLMPERHT